MRSSSLITLAILGSGVALGGCAEESTTTAVGGSGGITAGGAGGDAGLAGAGGSTTDGGQGGTAGATASGGSAGSGGTAASGGSGGDAGHGGSGGDGGTAATGGSGGAGGSGGSGGAGPAIRLFLAEAASVGPIAVWDDPGSLVSDVAPSERFGHASAATNVVGNANRLFAFRSGAFDIFDDPATVATGAAALHTVTVSSLGTVARPRIMGGHLWVGTGSPGNILLFESADSLTSTSLSSAEFTHDWGQLSDSAYLPGADRLLATQVSGAGLLAYDTATAATGVVEQDWIFSATSGWSMAYGGDSLYVSGGAATAHLRIYRNASTIGSTAVPTVEVTTGLSSSLWIGLYHGRLVMVSQSPVRAYLFADAATITGGSAPDVTIDLPTPGSLPIDMALDGADNLYVLYPGLLYRYADALGTPTLEATLDTHVDQARGLWLLE